MKSNNIYFLLRIRNAINLLIDAVILAILLCLIFRFHIDDLLFPQYVDNLSQLNTEPGGDNRYVRLNLKDIHYTGYKAIQNNHTGYYCYSIEDGKCYFFILKSKDTKPREITGKVIKSDSSTSKLIREFAKDINWSENSLEKYSNSIIVDENGYNKTMNRIFGFLMALFLSILAGHIIILVTGLIYPPVALTTLHNNEIMNLKTLDKVKTELAESLIYSQGDIRLTQNYLIGISYQNICIIPLENIVWAYYHSVLRRGIFLKHDISYTLRVVAASKKIYTIPHQKKVNCTEVLNIIQTMYPEIMIGYNEN